MVELNVGPLLCRMAAVAVRFGANVRSGFPRSAHRIVAIGTDFGGADKCGIFVAIGTIKRTVRPGQREACRGVVEISRNRLGVCWRTCAKSEKARCGQQHRGKQKFKLFHDHPFHVWADASFCMVPSATTLLSCKSKQRWYKEGIICRSIRRAESSFRLDSHGFESLTSVFR